MLADLTLPNRARIMDSTRIIRTKQNFASPELFADENPPGTPYPTEWMDFVQNPAFLTRDQFKKWQSVGLFPHDKKYPEEWSIMTSSRERKSEDIQLRRERTGFGNSSLITVSGNTIVWMPKKIFNKNAHRLFPRDTEYPTAWHSRVLPKGDEGEVVYADPLPAEKSQNEVSPDSKTVLFGGIRKSFRNIFGKAG